MGDRHGGRFARRGRALSPSRPRADAHRGVGFRWRAVGFRWRRVVGRICPAQKRSPRRKPPDTAHERKDLPRAETLPSAKASRNGARAKGFAPRKNTPLGESLPTQRTSKRICPTREGSPRRRLPDTAHERKDLPHARRLSSAKASRHGTRAKGFAPRENAPHGEGLPTRRTSERICPAQKRSPRRKPPYTAHERKDLPRGIRVCPTCRRTAGRSRPTDSRKTPLRRGRTREGAAAAEFIHRKK